MKKIRILGTGCAKCTQLYELTNEVASEAGLDCDIAKVTDIQEIVAYGVMITPALVVDSEVKVSGSVPSKEQILEWIK